MNEKIRDFFKQNIGYFIVALVSIVYIATAFITVDETGKTIGEIIADTFGRTDIPGVYAAGDVTDVPYKQIIIAMGEGAKAALSVVDDRMRGEIPS